MLSPAEFPEVTPQAFITLLLIGFVLGGIGHLYRWRPLIALGLLLMVAAVIVLPAVALLSR